MPIVRRDAQVGSLEVATLVIDRPRANVLDLAHCTELVAALRTLAKEDRARVVVVRGAGGGFSAGVDIAQHTPAMMPALLPAFDAIFPALLELQAVTVAAVHGVCLGGAAEIALACDRVVAERNARFGLPEMRVGCYPPAAIPLLHAAVGAGRATEMVLSGEEVAIDTLHAWGVIHRVCGAGELEQGLVAEQKLYADKSPAVLGMAVELLHAERRRTWLARIQVAERAYLTRLLPHPDATEGINAFLEKRPPVWAGKRELTP